MDNFTWRPDDQRALANEAIAGLYLILATLLFSSGWTVLGWVALLKGLGDICEAILLYFRSYRGKHQ